MRQPRIYKAATSIIIDPRPPRVLQDVSEVVDIGAGSYWATKEFYETEYNVIRSRAVSRKVVERLGLDSDLAFLGLTGIENDADRAAMVEAADPVAMLQRMISVEPVKDSRMVSIAILDTDPDRAARLSLAVSEAYIAQNVEKRVAGTSDAVKWLDEQVRTLKPRLEAAEMALFDYRKKNDILSTSLEDKQNIISQRLLDLNRTLTEVRTRRVALESEVERVRQLKKQGLQGAGLETLAEVTGSDTIERLKNEYFALSHELAALEEKYLEKHPARIAAEQRVATARAALKKEIDTIVAGIEGRYQTLLDTERGTGKLLDEVKKEAMAVNKNEIQYKRLLREKEEHERLYQLVLSRAKETGLTAQQRTNNIRLVDPPLVPKRPVQPRVVLNLAAALFLGLLGGVGLAFLREHLDNTLKNKDDIEERLNLPFMGIIPEVPERDRSDGSADLHILEHNRGYVAEACRSIRANLMFMSPEEPLRKLLITSAGPREGKTTTAVNLGIVMAQSGGRVLIIDTDMRRPRVHKALGVDGSRGLSNIIVGDSKLDDVVITTQVEGLFVLPCGPVPPNPAELLHTERFLKVLDEAAEKYDRVILDSPPLGAVADAKVLSQSVDGTLVVAKAFATTLEQAERASEALQDVNARILGVILNQVDVQRRSYGGYYYQYDRYGPYYGSDHDSEES